MRFAFGSIAQRGTTRGLVTRHVDLRSRGLRLGAAGLRIVVASDMHAHASWLPPRELERVVDAIRAVAGADVVAFLGDYTGNDPSQMRASAELYARIEAPIVAVLGNHDHWAGPQHATEALEGIGARVLVNESLPLRDVIGARGGDAWVGGLDSCWTGRRSRRGPDPAAAFAGVPEGADVVVLGHEPRLATLHQHALHLAGHTHLGQVRTPVVGDYTARLHMPRHSEPFPCRLYEVPVADPPAGGRDRRWVYTTAGIGFSTINLRVLCPPEIVVVDC